MSKFRQPYSRKHSPLFEGDTIFKQLKSSAFGRFQGALQDVSAFLPASHFQLPKVVVIGGKSAGKSSLLENITKCSVFPRDRDLSTKRPVKLQLSHISSTEEASVQVQYQHHTAVLPSTDAIQGEVDNIMKPLDAISEDEIVIKISQADVPTIELVDLPGIQLFPADMYEQTTQLVDHYLHEDNTLVLCVVDATIPSLDSSIALKMVRDANKLDSTILALTKADLIRDEESVVEHIFERVLKRSEEMADLTALAGCVAVVNRLHHDKISLLEAETAEQAIFNTMFEEPADAYAPQVIQQQLKSSTTTGQLICKLDRMFSEHIVKSWMPSVLTCIEKAANTIQEHIAELGPSPEELDTAQLLRYLVYQVQAKDICRSVSEISIYVTIPDSAQSSKECTLQYLDKVFAAQQLEWGSNAWAAALTALHEAVMQAVHNAVVNSKYLLVLEDEFAQAFSAGRTLKLERFEALGNVLDQHLLPTVVSKTMASCKANLVNMVHESFARFCGKSIPPDGFTVLSQELRGYIALQMHACLVNMGNADMIPSVFVLAEGPGSASARAALLEKLTKLQAAAESINQLAGLPLKGSYATILKADVCHKALHSAVQNVLRPSATVPGGFCFQWPATAKPAGEKAAREKPAREKAADAQTAMAPAPNAPPKLMPEPRPVPTATDKPDNQLVVSMALDHFTDSSLDKLSSKKERRLDHFTESYLDKLSSK